jgi:hypothetical protein
MGIEPTSEACNKNLYTLEPVALRELEVAHNWKTSVIVE